MSKFSKATGSIRRWLRQLFASSQTHSPGLFRQHLYVPLFEQMEPRMLLSVDLVVSEVSINPYPLVQGEPFSVTATISNNGDERANGKTDVAAYGFHVPASVSVNLDLAPGSSITVPINFADTGKLGLDIWYYWTVKVDPGNTIKESNEENNELFGIFHVVPDPLVDLVVEDITVSRADPITDRAVTITAVIENRGEVAIPKHANFSVDFFADGSSVDTQYITLSSSLASGETKSISTTFLEHARGQHEISAVVDPADSVLESNENNNDRSELFYWHLLGDLNHDFKVDDADLNLFLSVYGTGDTNADFDQSGVVDQDDLDGLISNFGIYSPPPAGDLDGDRFINDADLNLMLSSLGSSNDNTDLNDDGIVNDIDLKCLLFNFGSSIPSGTGALSTIENVHVSIGPVRQESTIAEQAVRGPVYIPAADASGPVTTRAAPRSDTPVFTHRQARSPFRQRARLYDEVFQAATQAEQRTFWWNETDQHN